MNKFINGEISWVIDSTIYVKEVEIINVNYDFATIRFFDTNGGMRVRINRLYKTKEEAQRVADLNKIKRDYKRIYTNRFFFLSLIIDTLF